MCAMPDPWGQSPATPPTAHPHLPPGLHFLRPLSPRCLHVSTVQVGRSPCFSSDTPSPAGLPPHRPLLLQRLCSGFRLSLLVLGFNVLMLVAICVIGSQREGRGVPWGMGWRQGPTMALRALRGARKRQRWDNRGGG